MNADQKTIRILLAEDNDFNREITVEVLTQHGYEVIATENGQQLIDELEVNPVEHFHLILMDLEMPIMDGHRATIAIRQKAEFDAIPILALTAHTSDESKLECKKNGMQDFISKPFEPSVLFATLEKFLSYKPNQYTVATPVNLYDNLQTQPTVLPKLIHIDTQLGLELCGGNHSLYHQLLQSFTRSQPATLLHFSATSDAEYAQEEFKRLIHTVKGMSGTIGASQLAQKLAIFEQELKRMDVKQDVILIETALKQITQLLDLCISEINNYLVHREHNNPQAHTTNSIIQADIVEITKELQLLLLRADSDASELFQTYRLLFEEKMEAIAFKELDNAMREYDFDKASAILEHALPSK
ncbi:response regulator [Undibacterium baiyunense]|uniref:Response regulator n=1 Tax=Undibacterium baiyunense TaxID=2828731 RepID=A0A941I4P8_9BURK|nr:response regulator [Undibacterium baiyunense]MBR7748100.1 response regulator [Undibacterium baiyunense]